MKNPAPSAVQVVAGATEVRSRQEVLIDPSDKVGSRDIGVFFGSIDPCKDIDSGIDEYKRRCYELGVQAIPGCAYHCGEVGREWRNPFHLAAMCLLRCLT